MDMKLNIGIPTLACTDLLTRSLRDLYETFGEGYVTIINNGKDDTIKHVCQTLNDKYKLISNSPVTGVPFFDVYTPDENLGVSGSWNQLMKTAFEELDATHLLILNDDIVLGSTCYDLHEAINQNPDSVLLTPKGGYNWSAFIISKVAYEKIGNFDECLYPAYFEDNDYHRRIKMQLPEECDIKACEALVPKEFINSETKKRLPNFLTNTKFEKNREYYIKKWGGLPGQELYDVPFNVKHLNGVYKEHVKKFSKIGNKNNVHVYSQTVLKKYIHECNSIIEITKNIYNTLEALSTRPKLLFSYYIHNPSILHQLSDAAKKDGLSFSSVFINSYSELKSITSDMVYINTAKSKKDLEDIMVNIIKINKYLVIDNISNDMREFILDLVETGDWKIIEFNTTALTTNLNILKRI